MSEKNQAAAPGSADAGRRYPVRPVLGVGAVILQVGEDQRRILLVERGNPPLVGLWSLPGGGVETGERLEEAIVREVSEETGLQVTPDSIAMVFERIIRDDLGGCEYHYVLIDFFCTIQNGDLCAGSDSRSVAWFEINDLPGLPMTEGTLEVIQSCCASRETRPHVTRP